MSNKVLIGLAAAVLVAGTAGCNTTDSSNANLNANANQAVATNTTRQGADNSEITTTTDANGVKTETRVFRNNPRVSKVVVTTTRDGRRTVRVHAKSGTEKVVDNVGDALESTGDALADAAGFVADKTGDAAKEVGDKAEDVGDQTVKGAKAVGKGATKAGKAIKKAVTP
jgi:hypothetical protein